MPHCINKLKLCMNDQLKSVFIDKKKQMSVCLFFMINMVLYIQKILQITIFSWQFISLVVYSKNVAFPRTLVMLIIKILVNTTNKSDESQVIQSINILVI